VERVIAITDGTAASGLPRGARAALGRRAITAGDRAAFLEDGTLAGSTLTMDAAFMMAIGGFGCGVVQAARLCSTNPARALGLEGQGRIAPGLLADLVVLGDGLEVLETWIGGVSAAAAPRRA
jgi:N-acetylglucosamine-6-phosphate deacetylase